MLPICRLLSETIVIRRLIFHTLHVSVASSSMTSEGLNINLSPLRLPCPSSNEELPLLSYYTNRRETPLQVVLGIEVKTHVLSIHK